MPALRADPDLFDLPGWQHRLEELRAEPQDAWRDGLIAHAEAHINALVTPSHQTPTQAR